LLNSVYLLTMIAVVFQNGNYLAHAKPDDLLTAVLNSGKIKVPGLGLRSTPSRCIRLMHTVTYRCPYPWIPDVYILPADAEKPAFMESAISINDFLLDFGLMTVFYSDATAKALHLDEFLKGQQSQDPPRIPKGSKKARAPTKRSKTRRKGSYWKGNPVL